MIETLFWLIDSLVVIALWLLAGWLAFLLITRTINLHPVLMWLTRRLRIRYININGQPYLERYWLGTYFGRTFYLHRFVSCDSERCLHDHPWNARAFVISGWYKEQRLKYLCSKRGIISNIHTRKAGFFNRLSTTTFHRIITARENTWTLFWHGKREKEWGFIEQNYFNTSNDMLLVTYQQTLDLTASIGWHKTAPLACESRLA